MSQIELRSVRDLLGKTFLIPNYQRGYRWTATQVNDFLGDIKEFIEKHPEKCPNSQASISSAHTKVQEDDFYCLQPLVVAKSHSNGLGQTCETKKDKGNINSCYLGPCDNTRWEVIDGQQRLTTLFIILSCMGYSQLYHLEYVTREGSEKFLKHIADNTSAANQFDNIDYCHMVAAKKCIREWLDKYKDTIDWKEYIHTLLDRVKFIWYESNDPQPIKVFTRLNIGRIPLTNAELVKALFLNRSNFDSETNIIDDVHLQIHQREIASEWDTIENALRNEEFWLFLQNKECSDATRIDFIFNLMYEKDSLGLGPEIVQSLGNDADRTFRYFHKYFTQQGSETSPLDKIRNCWKRVKSYYSVFEEWFNDISLYHYIGYLVTNGTPIGRLFDEWQSPKRDKSSFLDYLRNEIRKKLAKCPHLANAEGWDAYVDFQYAEDGNNKSQCKPILLFHNIQTVLNQNMKLAENDDYGLGFFYKFPFHLFKRENWDVEHITPNTDNDEEDDKTRQELLANAFLGVTSDVQEQIKHFFVASENERQLIFESVHKHFADGEWTSLQKNRIMNYVLLDCSTNRSYGNSIFSAKRRVIIGKEKGKLIPIPHVTNDGRLELGKETQSRSAFVPPCTKHAFMKYYSVMPGPNNRWTEMDAKGYRNDIIACLEQLGSPK